MGTEQHFLLESVSFHDPVGCSTSGVVFHLGKDRTIDYCHMKLDEVGQLKKLKCFGVRLTEFNFAAVTGSRIHEYAYRRKLNSVSLTPHSVKSQNLKVNAVTPRYRLVLVGYGFALLLIGFRGDD